MLAWQKADDLVVRDYQLPCDFPPEERYGLTSQFRWAAMSVAANITKGSGRQTLKDFRQFLFAAQGSLNEVQLHSPEL
ncbi:MAG: four helix bundle protein [Anaerolineae bacterium]|nr:four helix bundle protein [Anaerolineae bacterium]